MTRARRAWRGFAVAVAIFACAASCSSGGFLTSLDGAPPGGDDGGSAGRTDGKGSKDAAAADGKSSKDGGGQCGASSKDLCGNGSTCSKGDDCKSGLCKAGVCVAPPPTCTDGKKNGMETGVDCGGPNCAACAAGKGCSKPIDCQSLVCTAGVCQAPTDTDGVQNGGETAVDCGGAVRSDGTPNPKSDGAPACPPGKTCLLPSDCTQGVCNGTPVAVGSVGDAGVADGSAPADATTTDATVSDGATDAAMTASDAGMTTGDAGTVVLYCQLPSPTDGVANDSETDVDCGGGFLSVGIINPNSDGAPACAQGQSCLLGTDCQQGVCNANAGAGGGPIDCLMGATCACQVPWDNDGVQNGGETDVDCGGGTALGSDGAPPCATSQKCLANTDCQSQICTALGTCAAPTPTDGVKNDSETDVDCGGALFAAGGFNPASDGAPPCADAKGCALDSDCLSGFCSVLSNTCVDGQSCKGLSPTAQIMDQTGVVNPDGTVTVSVDANGDAIGVPDPNGIGQNAGIDTCGIGESTDPTTLQMHESCCKSLLLPGSTTLRYDKYEVTAGRIRQFLETVNYDVRDWALAQFDPTTGAATTQAGTMLAAQIPTTGATNVQNGTGVASTNALNLLPHSADTSEALNAVLMTGALVLDTAGVQGCFTNDGAGGAATYWWDADTIASIAGSPPRPFTQDYYDIKPMNCIPYYLAAAFCAWDGGRLPTEVEHRSAWGTALYPWGTGTPPTLYNGPQGSGFIAKATAAGLPITGYTVDWLDGSQSAGGQGDFYFYPSWIFNVPNEFVPDSLSNTLDLSVYIAAPGRFYNDKTTLRSTSFGDNEGWQDLGADMIEFAQSSGLTGTIEFCDASGIKGPNESYNCGTDGVIRQVNGASVTLLGGSWEGHAVSETLLNGWSVFRQYGKLGLRCVRPAEPAP